MLLRSGIRLVALVQGKRPANKAPVPAQIDAWREDSVVAHRAVGTVLNQTGKGL